MSDAMGQPRFEFVLIMPVLGQQLDQQRALAGNFR